jgi:cytoskeletal protein CcmA (bactofilin family)
MGWRSKPENKAANRGEIENILAHTSLCRGDLSADGAFRIDGWVEGSVESRSAVVIGESGAVRGNVRGTDVVVAGQVLGNVICSGHLEILASGKIEGDIDAQSVRIETGGIFRGTSHMGTETPEGSEAPKVPQALTPVEQVDDVPSYGVELSHAS